MSQLAMLFTCHYLFWLVLGAAPGFPRSSGIHVRSTIIILPSHSPQLYGQYRMTIRPVLHYCQPSHHVRSGLDLLALHLA